MKEEKKDQHQPGDQQNPNLSLMTIMATSAYLSQGGPPTSDQEEGGVMNLVNTSASQGYTLPREQVVRTSQHGASHLS